MTRLLGRRRFEYATRMVGLSPEGNRTFYVASLSGQTRCVISHRLAECPSPLSRLA